MSTSVIKLDPGSFKIRGHAAGKIMTEPKEKQPMQHYLGEKERIDKAHGRYLGLVNKDTKTAHELKDNLTRWDHDLKILDQNKQTVLLSQTCRTYLDEWMKEKVYGRRKEIHSKYLTKGLIMEDNSLDMAANHLGLGMLIKNDEQFSNDYSTGEPDAVPDPCVVDVKSSWDFSTFPLFDTECPNQDYWWQGQTYMGLTDKKVFQLVYTLTDTPQHLIESEATRYCYANGYDPNDIEIYKLFEDKMTYPDISPKMKIRSFEILRDDDALLRLKERVNECRSYIETRLRLMSTS